MYPIGFNLSAFHNIIDAYLQLVGETGVMPPIAILSRLQAAKAQLIVLGVADTTECGHGR